MVLSSDWSFTKGFTVIGLSHSQVFHEPTANIQAAEERGQIGYFEYNFSSAERRKADDDDANDCQFVACSIHPRESILVVPTGAVSKTQTEKRKEREREKKKKRGGQTRGL